MRNISIFLSLLLGAFASEASAQAWTGGGTNNNWSTGANWSGGAAPPSAATTAISFGPAVRFSPVVDTPWTINRIDFSTGGYSFTGQPITFAGVNPRVVVGINQSPIVISNPVVLTGAMVVSNFGFLDFTGGISGTGPITFAGGPGFSGLRGASTFTGGATVTPGHVLSLQGGSMSGPVTVNDAGILGGGGTISGPVSVNGGPGGGLVPSVAHGTMRVGNLTNSASLRLTISGTAQGIQYSHVDVTGTVNLASPLLVLAGSFVPTAGTVFTIITNDGTDPVVGTFASLPEGATVMFNGVPLTISYVGGTGNDVTLTAGAPLVAAAQTPTLSHLALLLLAALLPWIGATQLRRRSIPHKRG